MVPLSFFSELRGTGCRWFRVIQHCEANFFGDAHVGVWMQLPLFLLMFFIIYFLMHCLIQLLICDVFVIR